MKILEINKFFYIKGGSEVYMFDVRSLLKSHGHTVMDFAMNKENNEPSKYQKYFTHPVSFDGKQSIFSKMHSFFHVLYSRNAAVQLEKMFQEQGVPDVAHLHNFSYQLTPSIIRVLKKYHVPIVWTLHDYKVVSPNYMLYSHGGVDESTKPNAYFQAFFHKSIKNSYAQSFLASLEQYIHVKLTKWYRAVDVYVAPSRFMKDLVIDYGVPAQDVEQLYNFIHLDSYTPSYTHAGSYMCIVRLMPEKGVMEVLRAFKELPHLSLNIIGGGPMQEAMETYIKEHGMTNVTLLGPIYPPQLFEHLARAKALIMPSVWYENNPLVMLQAMALGKPIVGARIGGIPELIEEGVTGFTYNHVDVKDMIRAITTCERADLVTMGQRARKEVERIANPAYHYTRLMDIFEKAINKKHHVL